MSTRQANVTGYDLMRFLLPARGTKVDTTGLTLVNVMAGVNGVTLVFADADNVNHFQRLETA